MDHLFSMYLYMLSCSCKLQRDRWWKGMPMCMSVFDDSMIDALKAAWRKPPGLASQVGESVGNSRVYLFVLSQFLTLVLSYPTKFVVLGAGWFSNTRKAHKESLAFPNIQITPASGTGRYRTEPVGSRPAVYQYSGRLQAFSLPEFFSSANSWCVSCGSALQDLKRAWEHPESRDNYG